MIQKINLEKGENWISINVIPDKKSIYSIFNTKKFNEGDIIKSKTQQSVLKNKNWVGNLKKIFGEQMYIILVKKATELNISGKEIPLNLKVKIHKGENWIAYNNIISNSISNVYKNVSENDYIIYKNNKIIYKNNDWVYNTLFNFEPNKGYIIYSNNNTELNFYNTEKKENFKTYIIQKLKKTKDKSEDNNLNSYLLVPLFFILIIILCFVFKKFIK